MSSRIPSIYGEKWDNGVILSFTTLIHTERKKLQFDTSRSCTKSLTENPPNSTAKIVNATAAATQIAGVKKLF